MVGGRATTRPREGAILPHRAADVRDNVPVPVIVFVLLGHVPIILLLAQLGMLYLTVVDLREEDVDFQVKVWWFLLVLLFNVLGFVAEKLWVLDRRRRRRASESDRPAAR
jgi:hypothetical protein